MKENLRKSTQQLSKERKKKERKAGRKDCCRYCRLNFGEIRHSSGSQCPPPPPHFLRINLAEILVLPLRVIS